MSRVAVVKYSGNADNKFLDRKQYRLILDEGLKLMSGGGAYGKYLKALFPGGVVGMKTNCLAAFNPTLLPLVDALSEILQKDAGIEENDLVVWERTNRELKQAGFTLNASSFGRRCLGTDANGVGYDDDKFYSSGKVDSLLTRILTRMVDHNINLGVLKHHSIAGMSAGMKNMYGAVNNPNKYHANNCSPHAADINNLDPIRNKQKLTIIDAIRVQYDKGPGFDSGSLDFYNGIVLSEDPVAADRVALEIIEHLRRKNGRKPLADTGRQVKYLKAGTEIGLGIGDLSQIDLRVVVVDREGAVAEGELL
jgi:uncharacterized protein (DUF362 family)